MKTELSIFVPLILLLISAISAALPAGAEEAPDAAGSAAISAALQPFVDSHSLAGAVALVADKDKILSVEAVGFADIAAIKPLKTDAIFWIASQTKPMTATALMMLVDEGKLKLDDPVVKYLPEFRDMWLAVEHDNDHMLLKRPSHAITIREILSHTSGLPFASSVEQPTLDRLPLRDAVHTYALSPLQYEPGTKYQYANTGFNTAGRLIEVLSGMPYEKFMDERLFIPLGMKDTTFWPSKKQLTRLAKLYKPNADKTNLEETTISQLHYPLDSHERYPMPAGGLFSTAADLAQFCRMILNKGMLGGKRYLSEASIAEMTKKQTAAAIPDGYGLGWSTGGGNFGHGGAVSTNMNIDSNKGIITIWMVQHAGYPNNGDQSFGAFRKTVDEKFTAGK